MRAVVHHEFGDPAEVLAVEEVPLPDPGPGEVRIRTLLSPIHNHDLWTVRGTYGIKPDLPSRAGSEAVGVVDVLGPEVTGVEVGQRVVSTSVIGVWAEYFTARAAALIPVPDQVPDEAAAQLVSMPFSAISLLDSLGLAEGDWLVQNAANGAVGRMVAQLADSRGINVLGLVRRADGVKELADQGISRLSSGEIIFKNLTVKGFWGSQVSRTMPAPRRRELIGELLTRVVEGSLTLPVESIHPFEQIGAASTANFAPGRVGKILLRP